MNEKEAANIGFTIVGGILSILYFIPLIIELSFEEQMTTLGAVVGGIILLTTISAIYSYFFPRRIEKRTLFLYQK